MLEAIMTPKIFKNGLRNYLQNRAFKSATPTDLYRNFQKAVDKSRRKLPENLSIHKIMTTWDSQEGYPFVTVQRSYDKNQDIVKLTQGRYVSDKELASKIYDELWYIPINYASKSNPNFNDTRYSDWLTVSNGEISINNLNRNDWLILNKQDAFYYCVNYDEKNWMLIKNALLRNYSDIHILNRAQIIRDSFSMANNGMLNYSIPFEICPYLEKEDDYIIHHVFLYEMFYIKFLIHGSPVERLFQNYVIRILKRPYERLGVNPKANDTLIDKLHRIEVVEWMCKFDYPGCRENAKKTFQQQRSLKQLFSMDLQEVIMCSAIRNGNKIMWNALFKIYQSANMKSFKEKVFNSLGCTEDTTILKDFLDSSLNSSNKYTLQEVVTLISKNGLVGLQVAKDYVTAHFPHLQTILEDKIMVKLLTSITSYFTSEAQLDTFLEALRFKNTVRTADKVLQFVNKNTRLTVSANQKRTYQITKYFEKESDRSMCHTFPNIFPYILYSLIVTILCV